MTYVEACEIFDYWAESPPEHEMLAMLAKVYTTWEPKPAATEDLEKAGAMNAAEFFGHFQRTGGKFD